MAASSSALRLNTPRRICLPVFSAKNHSTRLSHEELHVKPLTEYVRQLKTRDLGEIPNLDPLDGGVEARILFLFEKPGPKTSVNGGDPGFITRNNNDDTAAATLAFMEVGGIARKDTVTWNAIPGWNGVIEPTVVELRAGAAMLSELFDELPKLNGDPGWALSRLGLEVVWFN